MKITVIIRIAKFIIFLMSISGQKISSSILLIYHYYHYYHIIGYVKKKWPMSCEYFEVIQAIDNGFLQNLLG